MMNSNMKEVLDFLQRDVVKNINMINFIKDNVIYYIEKYRVRKLEEEKLYGR